MNLEKKSRILIFFGNFIKVCGFEHIYALENGSWIWKKIHEFEKKFTRFENKFMNLQKSSQV